MRISLNDLLAELRSIMDRDAKLTNAAEPPVTSATPCRHLAGAG